MLNRKYKSKKFSIFENHWLLGTSKNSEKIVEKLVGNSEKSH